LPRRLAKRRLDRVDRLVAYNQLNRDAWVAGVARSLPAGARILDVGAGPCPYRDLFAHCRYESQDFAQYEGTSDGPLKDDWRYGEIDYVSDVTSIPVPDESFDAVLCTEVLEHVPDPVGAINEASRILRPGGRLFLTAPLASGLHQQPYHYYGGFTPHFYRKFLPEAGLEIVSLTPNGGFFRHLMQEVSRAADLIAAKRHRRWSPTDWLFRVVARVLAPVWLSRLDDAVFVEEFTVGYHVEARKRGSSSDKLPE
jgi:SAM-dependent methyltransferase